MQLNDNVLNVLQLLQLALYLHCRTLKTNIMSTQERIDQINEAIELISQAKKLVKGAIKGTSLTRHFEAYGGYGFSQIKGSGNPYDRSVQSLIDDLQDEEESEQPVRRKRTRN